MLNRGLPKRPERAFQPSLILSESVVAYRPNPSRKLRKPWWLLALISFPRTVAVLACA
jgi:hypothetical protein